MPWLRHIDTVLPPSYQSNNPFDSTLVISLQIHNDLWSAIRIVPFYYIPKFYT